VPADPTILLTEAPVQRKSLLWPGLFTLASFTILCGLGVWQLQRLEWKQGVIANMQARMNASAVMLPREAEWPIVDALRDSEYRKYRVTGTFDHARELLIFRAAGARQIGPVYHVITPLRLADGSTILINRGFVPQTLKDPAKRSGGQISGPVTITGYLRKAEQRNSFTPADTPDKGLWYSRDPKAMASHLKLQRAAPFLIEADSIGNPGGWPKGGVTSVKIPNNHLSYAWTWFGLAGALLAVFGVFAWGRRR
jgi:surfeit locus 1 family protein